MVNKNRILVRFLTFEFGRSTMSTYRIPYIRETGKMSRVVKSYSILRKLCSPRFQWRTTTEFRTEKDKKEVKPTPPPPPPLNSSSGRYIIIVIFIFFLFFLNDRTTTVRLRCP